MLKSVVKMNKVFEGPFLHILPKLDLHGETSDTIRALIVDFIRVNKKLGHHKLVIVHGRHGGVLKKTTHQILSKLPEVAKFYTYFSNDGVTIVELESFE